MARTPKKINKTIILSDLSPYELEGRLSALLGVIEQLIEQHGEDAYLSWDSTHQEPYSDSPSPRFEILLDRIETHEEYAKRIADQEKQKIVQEARELAELNRLQEKYKGRK